MQIPQIRVDQQSARIGIQIEDASVTINQGPAEQSIQQPEAEINIRTRPAKLTIDQSQAFRDLGQFPVGESVARASDKGMTEAKQGSSRRRRQGDMLMKIENGGKPIASIAKQNAPRQMRPFNIGFIPSHGSVDINYQPAEVEVNNTANKPVINAQATPTTQTFHPGQFDVYLEQKNWIDISFDNLEFQGYKYSQKI